MSLSFLFRTIDDKKILYAWFEAMHTRIDLIICNIPEEKARSLALEIQSETLRLDKMMNRFDESSELSVLNKHAAEKEVIISEELFHIIHSCMEFNKYTEGRFDITINSLNNYNKGIYGILLNKEKFTIKFNHPDIKLDFGGFGKGYALDRSIEILKNNQIKDALVSFGNSSIFALGSHPFGNGWKISNQPDQPDFTPVTLYDECLSTSGNSKQNDKHIISPETGEYINGTGSVSVKTKNAVLGEILSTSTFIKKYNFQHL